MAKVMYPTMESIVEQFHIGGHDKAHLGHACVLASSECKRWLSSKRIYQNTEPTRFIVTTSHPPLTELSGDIPPFISEWCTARYQLTNECIWKLEQTSSEPIQVEGTQHYALPVYLNDG